MSDSIYDKVLLKYMISFSIIAFIMVIIAIICVIYTFRHLDKDKEAKIVMSILSSIILIIASYICFDHFPKYFYDIKNNAYITYTGDFTVSDKYSKGSACWIYIDDDTKLESYSGLSSGNYTGTVIYAKRSAIAFEVEIDETYDED